jgi:hypothetical protein
MAINETAQEAEIQKTAIFGFDSLNGLFRAVEVAPDGTLQTTAGGGGGGTDVAIHDFDTPANHLDVDASGRITANVNGTVAVTGPLTDAQLRASAVPVSGTFFQGTQPVSIAGTVATDPTDEDTRILGRIKIHDGTQVVGISDVAGAKALKVDVIQSAGGGGSAFSQQDKTAFTEGTTHMAPIGGVFNDIPGADPGEDVAAAARITPKRALHVNLRNNSGIQVDPLTDTQLRTTPVQVNEAIRSITDTLTVLNDTVEIDCSGMGEIAVDVRGTFSQSITPEITIDGTNWRTAAVKVYGTDFETATISSPDSYRAYAGAALKFRLRTSSFTSGTATVVLRGNPGGNLTTLFHALPGGGNTIGAVDVTDRVARLNGVVRAQDLNGNGIETFVAKPQSNATLRRLYVSDLAQPTDTLVVATSGANAVGTATLPAAGAGLFHWITLIKILTVATGARAALAAPAVTTTNLGASPLGYLSGLALTLGGVDEREWSFAGNPWRSQVANTISTVVAAATGANSNTRIAVWYFTAP